MKRFAMTLEEEILSMLEWRGAVHTPSECIYKAMWYREQSRTAVSRVLEKHCVVGGLIGNSQVGPDWLVYHMNPQPAGEHYILGRVRGLLKSKKGQRVMKGQFMQHMVPWTWPEVSKIIIPHAYKEGVVESNPDAWIGIADKLAKRVERVGRNNKKFTAVEGRDTLEFWYIESAAEIAARTPVIRPQPEIGGSTPPWLQRQSVNVEKAKPLEPASPEWAQRDAAKGE
jgi:hypothetical protein